MHKININLHNLKNRFDFQYGNFARLFVSTWFTYVPNYKIFVAPRPRFERGVDPPPPPPGCEMGSKDPALVKIGLKWQYHLLDFVQVYRKAFNNYYEFNPIRGGPKRYATILIRYFNDILD